MKLEIEIDLADRSWDIVAAHRSGPYADRIIVAVLAARDALRPIQVGDRVRIPNSVATDWVVRFVDDDGWLTLRRATAGFNVHYACESAGVHRVTDGEA